MHLCISQVGYVDACSQIQSLLGWQQPQLHQALFLNLFLLLIELEELL
jgi:hypothetical protein